MKNTKLVIMNGYFVMISSKVFMFASFFLFFSTYNNIVAAPSPFILKLIHPSKNLSPHNNRKTTFFEQVQSLADSSMARYTYLKMKLMQDSNMGDVIQPGLTAGALGSCFHASISIGDPPITQVVQMDSGSGITWIQCIPCVHCFPQPDPYYDPSKSSSFSRVRKFTTDCKIQEDTGGSSDTCTYTVLYGDNDTTKGEIGKEKFTFTTSDEGIIAIPNLLFGCGHENYVYGVINGILGLDASPLSLVTQLGSKFSYCIGNMSDPDYKYNQLVIGEGALLQGATTPIEIIDGHYFLTLEYISFGNTKLNVNPNVFRRFQGQGGVLIDSGTFLNFIARSAYDALTEQVENWNSGRLPLAIRADGYLCYKGSMMRDLDDFPVVTFQFSGAAIEAGHEGMFFQLQSDVFCLSFRPVDDYNENIFGIIFQQYANVGYDIAEKTLYFEAMDCELLVS